MNMSTEPVEGETDDEKSTPLTGAATSAEEAEPSYVDAEVPDDGDVQEDPGSQISG